MEWPPREGDQPTKLREATNDYTCFPHMPTLEGNAPMCLDRVGSGYMLAPGASGSNTDPDATKPTADNEWGCDPPHMMIIVPDDKALEGIPTTRQAGAPWVMWRGTPYVHIMVPIVEAKKKWGRLSSAEVMSFVVPFARPNPGLSPN